MSGVPLNLDWQQILLHLLNFVILFAILFFLLYKPVKDFMEKRKAAYQEIEDQANADKAEAESLKEEYAARMETAEAEIAKIKHETYDEAEKKAKEITRNAETEAAEILAKARTQAEAERGRIIDEAGDEIKVLAKDAAKKAIFESTSEAYDSFLDMVEDEQK